MKKGAGFMGQVIINGIVTILVSILSSGCTLNIGDEDGVTLPGWDEGEALEGHLLVSGSGETLLLEYDTLTFAAVVNWEDGNYYFAPDPDGSLTGHKSTCVAAISDTSVEGDCFRSGRVCHFFFETAWSSSVDGKDVYYLSETSCKTAAGVGPFLVPLESPLCGEDPFPACPDDNLFPTGPEPDDDESDPRRPIGRSEDLECDSDLFSKLDLESPPALRKIIVDARVGLDTGNGSEDRPYRSIREGLNAATEKPAEVVVHAGEYEGNFSIPVGVRLIGEEGAIIRNRNGSVSFQVAVGNETELPPSVLKGFEIRGADATLEYAAVKIPRGAVAVVQENIIFTSLSPVTWATYGDTDFGTAIQVEGAEALILENEIQVPSETPDHVISRGILLTESCAQVSGNRIDHFRIPVSIREGEVVLSENVIENSLNGIMVYDSSPMLESNEIRLEESSLGCGYAVYMEGKSRPAIEGNDFYLGGRAKGINESVSLEADPVSLVDNRFFVEATDTTLYMDADGTADPGRVNQSLFNIEEVNSLSDIPDVGGNSVQEAL